MFWVQIVLNCAVLIMFFIFSLSLPFPIYKPAEEKWGGGCQKFLGDCSQVLEATQTFSVQSYREIVHCM